MSFDEPEGYLDDIAETRETEALRRSGDDWSSPVPTSSINPPRSETSADPSGSGPGTDPLPSRAPSRSTSGTPPEPPSVWRERWKRWFRFTRTMLVTALVLAGLAALGNIAIHHLPRTTTHTYTYSNIQRVLIAVDGNGSVDVHGVDGDQVTVKAKDKATLLEPVQRQIISSGGWLLVSVHCPSSECSSKYDVQVPREASVHVILDHSTDQSDITAQNLASPVDLFTGHGDVTLDHMSADIHVVANGRVAATNISAAVDVFAPIGDKVAVQVTGIPQNVNLTSGQDATVTLSVPAGPYAISCLPVDNCKAPDGTSLDNATGPVHQDPTADKKIQINVHTPTVAHIGAG
jgi:hypothetical protein